MNSDQNLNNDQTEVLEIGVPPELRNRISETGLINLSDTPNYSAEIVGNKARNLGILVNAGLNVPSGFVIPTSGFDNEDFDHEAVITEYRIRDMQAVAVRSSGVSEDEADDGLRGIYTTSYLTDEADLIPAILRTRTSSQSDRAKAYHASRGKGGDGEVAVIIQELVNAQVSGVIATNGTDQTFIEVVEGMGDQLVDGIKNPESYEVRDGVLQTKIKVGLLSDDQIVELDKIAKHIVSDLFDEHSQEIEFCYDQAGRLYLLQSRPLPSDVYFRKEQSLSAEEAIGLMEEQVRDLAKRSPRGEVFLSNSNIAENLGLRPSVIAADIFGQIFAGDEELGIPGAIQLGRQKMGYACGEETYGLWGKNCVIGGQPYFDIVKDALTFRLEGFELDDYMQLVDGYIEKIKADPRRAQYPEIGLYQQVLTQEELAELFGAKKADEYYQIQTNFLAGIRQYEDQFAGVFSQREDEIFQYLQTNKVDLAEQSDEQLVALVDQHLTELRTGICVDFVQAARLGFFAFDRVRDYIDKHKDLLKIDAEQVDDNALLITANPYGEPYGNPQTDMAIMLANIKRGQGTMEDFLSNFGHSGITQLDIAKPRFSEQKEMLSSYVMAADVLIEEKINKQLVVRDQKLEELKSLLSENGGEGLEEFLRDVNNARLYLVFRERIKFDYLRIYDQLKDVLTTLGQRHELGNQIFDLTIREVTSLPTDSDHIKTELSARQEFLATTRGMYKPPVIFSENVHQQLNLPAQDSLEATRVIGQDALTGRVVRVFDPFGVQLERQGDEPLVIVTEATDPGWTAFLSGLRKGDALVVEVGGALSHEAVAAAGFGFTVVCGVDGATSFLNDGQLVQIDPKTNKLTIIKEPEMKKKVML